MDRVPLGVPSDPLAPGALLAGRCPGMLFRCRTLDRQPTSGTGKRECTSHAVNFKGRWHTQPKSQQQFIFRVDDFLALRNRCENESINSKRMDSSGCCMKLTLCSLFACVELRNNDHCKMSSLEHLQLSLLRPVSTLFASHINQGVSNQRVCAVADCASCPLIAICTSTCIHTYIQSLSRCWPPIAWRPE